MSLIIAYVHINYWKLIKIQVITNSKFKNALLGFMIIKIHKSLDDFRIIFIFPPYVSIGFNLKLIFYCYFKMSAWDYRRFYYIKTFHDCALNFLEISYVLENPIAQSSETTQNI